MKDKSPPTRVLINITLSADIFEFQVPQRKEGHQCKTKTQIETHICSIITDQSSDWSNLVFC